MNEDKIGTIVHYWPRAGAAQVEIEHGLVQVGDRIRIRGRDREFEQEILSLEVDHVSKSEGRPGEFVAIAVDQPVHAKDEVWVVRALRSPGVHGELEGSFPVDRERPRGREAPGREATRPDRGRSAGPREG